MRSLLALLVVLAVPLVSAARSTRWLATIQSEHTGDTATVTLQAGRARPIGATRGCEPTFSPVILVAARRARPDGVDSPSFGSTIRSPPPTRSCDGAVARATPISWGCHNPASTSGPFTGSTPASPVHRCGSPTVVRSRLMSGADEDNLPRRHTARESLLDGASTSLGTVLLALHGAHVVFALQVVGLHLDPTPRRRQRDLGHPSGISVDGRGLPSLPAAVTSPRRYGSGRHNHGGAAWKAPFLRGPRESRPPGSLATGPAPRVQKARLPRVGGQTGGQRAVASALSLA